MIRSPRRPYTALYDFIFIDEEIDMGHLKDRPHRRRWGTAMLAAGLMGGTAWQAAFAQPLVTLPDFTPIIQHYGAAVVNISSTST